MNDSDETKDVRKVTPIRVVNLASLQDIKVVKKDMPTRQSRRKSVHQVRSNSDDQIEFIESSNDEMSNSTIASSSNSAQMQNNKLPNAFKRTSPKKKSLETRPNESLMKRVALLRVCAEYMLGRLQVKNVSFGENQSLEMLKAQYMRNLRRNH